VICRDRKNQVGEASCRICLEKFSTPIDCEFSKFSLFDCPSLVSVRVTSVDHLGFENLGFDHLGFDNLSLGFDDKRVELNFESKL